MIEHAIKGISGSDWTPDTLKLFDIRYSAQTYEQMFTQEERTEGEILYNEENGVFQQLLQAFDQTTPDFSYLSISQLPFSKEIKTFFTDLKHAFPEVSEESKIDKMIKSLFQLVFVDPPRISMDEKPELSFVMSQNYGLKATPDVMITRLVNDTYTTAMIVQEDKRGQGYTSPYGQIVAESIATFQKEQLDRQNRHQNLMLSLPLLMGVSIGTTFTFLRSNITSEVVEAVEQGERLEKTFYIGRYHTIRDTGFSFNVRNEFAWLLRGLACWKYLLANPLLPIEDIPKQRVQPKRKSTEEKQMTHKKNKQDKNVDL